MQVWRKPVPDPRHSVHPLYPSVGGPAAQRVDPRVIPHRLEQPQRHDALLVPGMVQGDHIHAGHTAQPTPSLKAGSIPCMRCWRTPALLLIGPQFTNMALAIYDLQTAWDRLVALPGTNANFFGEKSSLHAARLPACFGESATVRTQPANQSQATTALPSLRISARGSRTLGTGRSNGGLTSRASPLTGTSSSSSSSPLTGTSSSSSSSSPLTGTYVSRFSSHCASARTTGGWASHPKSVQMYWVASRQRAPGPPSPSPPPPPPPAPPANVNFTVLEVGSGQNLTGHGCAPKSRFTLRAVPQPAE